jgi:hypothetical protein
MQYGGEDGSLNGKVKAPAFEQGGQDFIDGAGLPEPLKDQRGADPGATGGDAVAPRMGAEYSQLL